MTPIAQATSVDCEPTKESFRKATNATHFWFEAYQRDGLFYSGSAGAGVEHMPNTRDVTRHDAILVVGKVNTQNECTVVVSFYDPESADCVGCAGKKITKFLIEISENEKTSDGKRKAKLTMELDGRDAIVREHVGEMKCAIPDSTVKDECTRAKADNVDKKISDDVLYGGGVQ